MQQTDKRPLSPHLGVYKWRYTFLNPSVIHRGTGLMLSAGMVLLVYFLYAVANGPDAYARAAELLSAPAAKIIYVGVAWSFFFHLLAGIRHLAWDTGRGFGHQFVRVTGLAIYAAATVLAAVFSLAVIF